MEKYFLKLITRAATVLTLLIVSSCGKSNVVDENKPVFDENVSWGSVVQKADGEYSGTGGFRFLRTLTSSQVSVGLELVGNLDNSDSSIEYVMFATNPNLSDGVHIRFYRDANGQLLGSMDINNAGAKHIVSQRLSSYSLSPLKMSIDIHSLGTGVRVMTYVDNATTPSPFFFDSRRAGDLADGTLSTVVSTGGIHGGILLNNSSVRKAVRRDPVTPREQAL